MGEDSLGITNCWRKEMTKRQTVLDFKMMECQTVMDFKNDKMPNGAGIEKKDRIPDNAGL